MDLCDQCGNKSLMPEHYSDVCLCKKCSMKLLSSTWKNKEYDSNEEIDRQMEKVIKLAGKYSYSPKVIEGLSSFFSSKKIDGLYRKFSGGCGQKIIVCSDRLIIKTEADFDIKEIRKAYKRMCAGKRGAIGIGDYVSAQQATQIVSMAIGNIVPGRGFIKSGIKALGSGVASNAISGNVSYNEKPQKSETYEENGISYKKEKYLSYEITYPVLNKNIKDKSFVQYIDYQCYWCGYNRPTSDPSDSYKGEPYDLQIYHKEWELPADIEKQNISEITYTVYNKPGTFVNEYQQAKIVRQAQSNGGYNPSPYITISGDCNDIVYLAVIAEYYGRADDNENSSILYQNSFNDTIIGVKVKYNDESVKEAYYILEFNENMPPKESDKMFILYRLTLEE